MKKEGFNKSFIFLLPILVQYLPYSHDYYDSLVDSYIYDSERKYKQCLTIEHKFDIIKPEFKKYEDDLMSNILFIDLIDRGNNSLYVFKFPENYLKDYNLFELGKYSQMSKEAQSFVMSFWSTLPSKHKWKENFLIKLNRIFNKDPKLRVYWEDLIGMKLPEDSELASTIYEEHETF